jgi:glycosyltransferase involved in cell wall biosynthesis
MKSTYHKVMKNTESLANNPRMRDAGKATRKAYSDTVTESQGPRNKAGGGDLTGSTRIVYVNPYYNPAVPSGANRRVGELIPRFVRDYGDNFTLIVTRGMAPLGWTGKNLIEVDYEFNHKSKFAAVKQIAAALDALPPSIVIVESIPIPFRALKRHVHFQVAYDFRYFYPFSKSFLYRLFFSQYLKWQWGHSQFMVTCSEFSIDELARHVGYPKERVVKSFFGINEQIFNVPHLSPEQKEYDLIYVGHFDGHKNHAPLIDALGMMDKNLKVLFIGVDNGLLASLKERAANLGLSNISWMTVKDEKKVWEYYTKSRVFVSPSVYEGFGMPTIEALALGLPVVISDIQVFHEVGGDLATYFDPHDPEDIAAKLSAALANPTPPDAPLVRTQLDPFLWDNIYTKFIADFNKFSA